MASHSRLVLTSLTALALLLAACGGEDRPTRTATPAASRAAGQNPVASPSPSPSSAVSPEATSPPTSTPAPTPSLEPTEASTVAAGPTPTVLIGEWGNAEIYVMNADGSEQRRLTTMPTGEIYPAWSPDGTTLAFVSFENSQGRLYLMDADGSNVRWLSDAATTPPAWSPDGSQILVVSGHGYEGGYHEIFAVAADGSGERQLTSFTNVPTAGLSTGNDSPTWSSAGDRIAFISHQKDGPSELYVMNPDGTGVQRLTDSQGDKWDPDWSADGQRIAFVHNNPDPEIWIVNADGSGLQQVTASPTYDLAPRWSPDGGHLAFARQSDAGPEIVIVNADGNQQLVPATGLSSVQHLNWSPDGTRIALASDDPMDNSDILVLSLDDGSISQLTDAPHTDGSPVWSPDGSMIAFSSNRDGGQPVECNWSVISDYGSPWSAASAIWSSYVIVAGTIVEEHGPAFGKPISPVYGPNPVIYTDYTLEVERQFRGQPRETIRLRTNGGKIGDCAQDYQPEVIFTTGMRVLLFLGPETTDNVLPPAYVADVAGLWNVSVDDRVVSSNLPVTPEEVAGLTLDEVAALVAETLAGEPPENTFAPVSLDESPATPQ